MTSDAPSPEEETLEELREAEADLSSPHLLEHYVSFPFASQAYGAAEALRSRGFDAEVGQDEEEPEDWLVVARHELVLTLRSLAEVRRHFEELATLRGGEYAGWLVRLDEEGDWEYDEDD